MPSKWHFPFNLFSWSTAILLLFLAIQLTVVMAFASTGYRPSPFLTLFTWGAVSAAITFAVVSRCEPSLNQLLVLQGFACFYMLCLSIAATLRNEGSLSAAPIALVAGSIIALFASGSIGAVIARVIRERLPR